MPPLHVCSIPEDFYVRARQLVQSRRCSLSAQVVTMLYEALDKEEQFNNQVGTLASSRRRRFAPPKKAVSSDDGYTTPACC